MPARPNGRAADVVVTGVGLVTPLGGDVATTWRAMLDGTDATGDLTRFPASAYRVRRACELRDVPGGDGTDGPPLMLRIAVTAAREAAAEAGLPDAGDPTRRALVLGTLGSADLRAYEARLRAGEEAPLDAAAAAALMPSEVSAGVAAALGCAGPVGTVLTACASGNHAIAMGRRWIQSGRADVVLAGGADVLSQTQYTHFHNLRALAPDVCRPFDRGRRGLVIGEGAGFLVLEAAAAARARGARVLARVLGAGASADAYHMTAPEPDGGGARRALLAALADAGIGPDAVDYVSAHGTGTPLNDRVEAHLLRDVFGRAVPASSVKSMIGHCMGAASVIEAAVCVLALRDQVVPPTLHLEDPDPDCPVDCVPHEARALPVRVAVNNAFAFGGNNCIVVLGAHA